MTSCGVSAGMFAGKSGLVIPNVTNLKVYLLTNTRTTRIDQQSGSGTALAFATPNVTLTKAGAFTNTNYGGKRINIAGASSGGNNGNFAINATAATNTVSYNNTAGATQVGYAGAWQIGGYYSQIIELKSALTFAALAANTGLPYDDVTFAGKPVAANSLASGATGAANLAYTNSTLGAAFTGATLCSFSMRVYASSFAAGATLCYFERSSDNLSYTTVGWNSTSLTMDRASTTGVTSTWTVAGLPSTSTWATLGWKYNAGSPASITTYINGVNQGTSATQTARNMASIDRFWFTAGLVTTPQTAFCAGYALGSAGWSDAEFLQVHNSFVSNGCP